MANILNIQNGAVISGSFTLPNLTDSSTSTKILLLSSSGQVFTTASSAIGGGGGSTVNNYYYNTSSFIATGSVTASVNTGTGNLFTMASSSTTFMVISASGNVGIGTTTPRYILDVSGSTGNFSNGLIVSGGITGSLLGTSSWASNAVTSSYPLSVSGTTLYSVYNSAPVGFNITNSILIGNLAGASASNASSSNFLGYQAGWSASNADHSTFIGYEAGFQAINARNSVIIGQLAGKGAQSASFSTLIGYNVGYNPTNVSIGSNNIIIGTNITLPKTASNSINIGGILFGTGSYSASTGNPFSGSAGGKIGINVVSPTYNFQVSGTVGFPDLTNSSTATKVVLLDGNGQLFTTASSALGGGSTTPIPTIKASASLAASFTGTPLTTAVAFTTQFSDTNYSVTVTGEDPRAWSIESKGTNGFTINSNSSVALTGKVYWIATPYSNS